MNFRIKVREVVGTCLMRLFGACPISQRKIVFVSWWGQHFNDNPRAIFDELIQREPDLDCVWVTNNNNEKIENARVVRSGSIAEFYELATARVWVDNCRKRYWTVKRRRQYYIQTWHGNLGNKKVEGAAMDTLPSGYVRQAKKDAEKTDLMISGSRFFDDLIRNYFWYNGEILRCGTPRLDVFFSLDEQRRQNVRQALNIKKNCRILLYAPTFRSDFRMDCYDLDYERVIETLNQQTGDEWIVLVRLHPNVASKVSLIRYSENIINASAYPDLYELIPLADIIITDYSSIAFEAALLKKPIYQFALDLDVYEAERGFYWNVRELPFILAQSNDELIDSIKSFDKERYQRELDAFLKLLGIQENGTATKTVVNRILDILKA